MTTTDHSSSSILAAARQLQEQKMNAVARLAASRENIATIAREMAAAERDDAVAWAEALKGGWTESELKAIGLAAPARKAPGRPRSGRSRNALVDAQLQHEAAASVALDRDQTHVVGDPA